MDKELCALPPEPGDMEDKERVRGKVNNGTGQGFVKTLGPNFRLSVCDC